MGTLLNTAMLCPTLDQLPPPATGQQGWPWTEATPPVAGTMPDGRPWPRITIITPSYNQRRFVEETIRSVLLQGYPHLEYLVMDGGSTDGSVDTIRAYASWLTAWESAPDRGQGHAINKGLAQATGQILAWLNSDDVYRPGALQQMALAFARHPGAAVVVGGCAGTDANRREVGRKTATFDPADLLIAGRGPAQPGVFFSRSARDRVGGLNEQLHYVLDKEYWFRIMSAFAPDAFILIAPVVAEMRSWERIKSLTGGLKVWDEYRFMVDQFYATSPRSAPYARLRRAAYSQIAWNTAWTHLVAGHRVQALRSTLRAVWLAPGLHRPIDVCRHLGAALVPRKQPRQLGVAVAREAC